MSSIFPSIRFGGDYNPDQWDPSVWDDDVRLMRGASVTTATVGVFSWARLEPRPGEFDFGWLDTVLEKLDAGGIRVILATATASPPAWLATLHPESLPVDERGSRFGFGSRQQYSPSSAVYREHALRLVRELAARYGAHPALEAWHTNNEYGCHVAASYDDESVAAFRAWLARRYGTVDELNRAWGTGFWSQRYGSFDEVDAPRHAPTFRNPTQLLDWKRFSSWALLELHRAERSVLAELSPGVPVTTNFMGFFADLDYWDWSAEMDFISDDEYPDPSDPLSHVLSAATRDLMRSLGGGRPWLLMEQSPSAVNWRDRNAPKAPGQHRATSFQSVARGADGILHFQWRQSASGAEKFHAAMVPHGGENTRVHREVQALGRELAELSAGDAGVLGAPVPASVAIVWDWESWWALGQEATPTRIDYLASVLEWYGALLRRGVTINFVRPGADTAAYRLVVAPLQQVGSGDELAALAAVVERGDTLVVGFQTGILDRDLHVHLGGYLGGAGSALQRALGVSVEEFAPLQLGVPTVVAGELEGTAGVWQEHVRVTDAAVLASFADGHASGGAAITRRATEAAGAAWYVATQPSAALFDALFDRVLADAGVEPAFAGPEYGVETAARGGARFVINHTGEPREVVVAGTGVSLEPFGVAVLTGSEG
ncbi:beta-galactosidase [Gryllotalpicola protaetiae]|uniref:beta-galactosidase n=1 Tax=Gryllotalpicola protaetiae TaxID=2419771 RepID=UPI001FEB1075|nr:beta-galactosidase [Gryllotalpicola protaetiae]